MPSRLSILVENYVNNLRLIKPPQAHDVCHGCGQSGIVLFSVKGDGRKQKPHCHSCIREMGLDPQALHICFSPEGGPSSLSLETVSGQ